MTLIRPLRGHLPPKGEGYNDIRPLRGHLPPEGEGYNDIRPLRGHLPPEREGYNEIAEDIENYVYFDELDLGLC